MPLVAAASSCVRLKFAFAPLPSLRCGVPFDILHYQSLRSHLSLSSLRLRTAGQHHQRRIHLTTPPISASCLLQHQKQHHTHPLPPPTRRLAPPGLLRSPHQWSHVIHRCRQPIALGRPSVVIGEDMAATTTVQTRSHMGHSHHHHHHHDNTYLTSTNRSDPGVRITRIGLYVNLGMAIVKGAGGYVFNSKVLIADAVHALTDLVSDIATLATVSYSVRPVTKRFPLGYGKIESLGALCVSGLLLSGGFMIGVHAVMSLAQQFFPEIAHLLSHIGVFEHAHSHSHSHGTTDLGPNIHAAWLAGGSILSKEWLYRATMKVAKQKRSSVLASNAYHHRVDSLTAVVALLAICASHFISNASWLDPVGGLVIAGMVVQAGWVNSKTALLELADVAVESEISDNVAKTARTVLEEEVGSTAQIRGVQGIKSGQNILIDIEVAAPASWTMSEMARVEEVLREKVAKETRGVRRVAIRFSDVEVHEEPFQKDFVARGENEDPEHGQKHEHDHDHDPDHGRSSGNATMNGGQAHKRH